MTQVLDALDGTQVNVVSPATTTIPLTVQAVYLQTADLVRIKDYLGNTLWRVQSDGTVSMDGTLKIVSLGTCTSPGDAANKSYVDARTPKTTVSTTAPSSPSVGDVWIDTN